MSLGDGHGLEAMFKHWTEMLAFGIELFAALIIGLAAIEAAVRVLIVFAKRDHGSQARTFIRIHLGRWLALALEFTLAADILATAVAPTWDDIGRLAAIIVLRTLLNYFLQREVNEAAEQAREIERHENAGVAHPEAKTPQGQSPPPSQPI